MAEHEKAEIKDFKLGSLPCRAPLSVPFVPFQDENPPMYDSTDGLNRGTMFPGLDLPWKNTVNKSNPAEGTLLGELTALEFAADDLQLYMDTHKNDKETFQMLKNYLEKAEKARKKYVKVCGPVSREDIREFNEYEWLRGPWPWEYTEGMC